MARLPSESGKNGRSRHRRSDLFVKGLKPYDLVTFVSHINPDPDSLGSMLGLAHLVESTLGTPTRLTRDGPIGRAENALMVDLLDLELIPVDAIDWQDNEALVMVDSQPNTGRHTFDPSVPVYAVLDHHDTPGDLETIPFVDVRQGIGATCTLVTKYLIEQEVEIPQKVATALLYGIETEQCGFPRESTPADDSAMHVLFPLAEKDILAEIRNAPLPHNYFECMLQALQSSFLYDRLIISWVHDLPQPEMASQVADFLIRFERVDWALCAGVYGDQLILSIRSAISDGKAGNKLRTVVGELGRAGGHDRRAGGFIQLPSTSASAIEQMQAELRRRLLKVLNIDECRGQRLVPRREMLQNIIA
ncbi:MAG: bifunctional oligoribonuclease/PAP phosphatase NrnA [Gemmataceae bacterium]